MEHTLLEERGKYLLESAGLQERAGCYEMFLRDSNSVHTHDNHSVTKKKKKEQQRHNYKTIGWTGHFKLKFASDALEGN